MWAPTRTDNINIATISLNEIDNTEKNYSSNGVMAALDLTYRFRQLLDFTLTTSYQRNTSDNDTWFGEKSNYVAQLRNSEYGVDPIPGQYGKSDLPTAGCITRDAM